MLECRNVKALCAGVLKDPVFHDFKFFLSARGIGQAAVQSFEIIRGPGSADKFIGLCFLRLSCLVFRKVMNRFFAQIMPDLSILAGFPP